MIFFRRSRNKNLPDSRARRTQAGMIHKKGEDPFLCAPAHSGPLPWRAVSIPGG